MLADFYAESRWGDRWNAPRANGRRHKGFDVVADAGESIPALRPGVVTAVFWHPELGWTIVVETAPGDVTGYSHIKGSIAVGTDVDRGDHLASIAGRGEETGSAWSGPHTHVVVADSQYRIYMGPTRDPEPYIVAALQAFAGGSALIPPNAGSTTSIPGEDMHLMRTTDGKVWLVTANGMVHVNAPAHLAILQRVLRSVPGTYDTFNEVERLWVASYVNAANTSDDAETKRILDALAAVKPIVDPAPVVAAVKAALASVGVGATPDQIAAAVETRLKDEFTAIPTQVNADAARRLTT